MMIACWTINGVSRTSSEYSEVDALSLDDAAPESAPRPRSPAPGDEEILLAPVDQGPGVDWQRKLLEDYCRDIPADNDRLQDMCAVWLKAPGGTD